MKPLARFYKPDYIAGNPSDVISVWTTENEFREPIRFYCVARLRLKLWDGIKFNPNRLPQ